MEWNSALKLENAARKKQEIRFFKSHIRIFAPRKLKYFILGLWEKIPIEHIWIWDAGKLIIECVWLSGDVFTLIHALW